MGDKEKQGSNEAFSGSLGNPLDLIGIKVLWFHRRLFLAHRGHWERREIVCCWFFSDVTPGLSFNGSNMTVTVSLIWFSYLLLWAGEDAADVRTMEVFLLGGGQSQAVLEEKWRQVGNEESGLSIAICPELCSWDAGKPKAMVNLMVCDLWAWLIIFTLQSVFLEQVWRVCVSRSCCSVQFKCYWELLGEVHDYNDSSMCLQLCFVKDKCPGNLVIH